ncbi:MAG: class I SAM-dependent methyltransferase [Candidatus Accumulibacter meliphilus]|jgi:SAM-dependent methyltransferase|uniref:Class I SAM-dependent methyltransferase n=1 Tax=Candidatus Accumulibacter meliphilus TaxID=2211374 RepID=A0A369XN91_9PROT|nr:MAG: class I SAM-dependent methyltransferase [Candidatus Accumulibacter meliphilus]
MPTRLPEIVDYRQRSIVGCLCCGNQQLRHETQIVSGFLAARAWGGPPQATQLAYCGACGFRFFDCGLSAIETARYYRGYRNPEYLATRRRWEPFYTPRQHAAQVEWSRSTQRIDALREALAGSAAPRHFVSALDHGGNEGHMLAAVAADRKAVFDPSGCATLDGIEAFSDANLLPGGWDLILSCQVLEHVSAPAQYLRDLAALLADGGLLYVEVPAEAWRPAPGSRKLRDACLRLLLRNRPLLIAADVLCTASRIKLGRLPPLGFVAMREHLNYFTTESVQALLCNSGFVIDASGINSTGQIFALARKTTTNDDPLGEGDDVGRHLVADPSAKPAVRRPGATLRVQSGEIGV